MLFKVTKQFVGGRELDLQAFLKRDAAEAFVQDKLTDDLRFKIQATYRIYDDLDSLLREYTPADAVAASTGGQSSSGKPGSSQSFNPTPFNTKPQPGGLPHNWITNEEDKEDEEDK